VWTDENRINKKREKESSIEIGEEIVIKKKDKMLNYKIRKNTPSPHQMKKKYRVIRVFLNAHLNAWCWFLLHF